MITVDVEHSAHRQVDNRQDHCDGQCGPERRNLDTTECGSSSPHEKRVEYERKQPNGPHDQWQGHSDNQRPDEGIQDAEGQHHPERGAEPGDCQPVKPDRYGQQHDRLDDTQDHHACKSPRSGRAIDRKR